MPSLTPDIPMPYLHTLITCIKRTTFHKDATNICHVKIKTEQFLHEQNRCCLRLTNCGRCAIAFPLSRLHSIRAAVNQCPPTQYAACIYTQESKAPFITFLKISTQTKEWKEILFSTQNMHNIGTVIGKVPSALDWRTSGHFLECHMPERPETILPK